MNASDFSSTSEVDHNASSFHQSGVEVMAINCSVAADDVHPCINSLMACKCKDTKESAASWPLPVSKNGAIKINGFQKEDGNASVVSKQGLLSIRGILLLSLWYFFSFTTLFLNKYILSYQKGDPTVLGSIQLLICCFGGYFHVKYPCGYYRIQGDSKPHQFLYYVVLVGTLRFLTLLLGLIALWYVPVSFAETVKSSAPVFTLVISRILIGEQTTCLVNLSLIPVMGGLALCSANELSFNTAGFIAAVSTNLSECLQNVYSKILLSGEIYKCSPPELQFYTSLASICVQIPTVIVMVKFPHFWETFDSTMATLLILNGISFHCQSITEYTLLCYISPITHSVANTAKRALLIWLSVVTFGNPVTFLSGLGTATVIIGVLLYNNARQRATGSFVPSQAIKRVHTI